MAFHTTPPESVTGDIMHADEWWGEKVDLDFYNLDPADVAAGLAAAGFTVMARTDRAAMAGAGAPDAALLFAVS